MLCHTICVLNGVVKCRQCSLHSHCFFLCLASNARPAFMVGGTKQWRTQCRVSARAVIGPEKGPTEIAGERSVLKYLAPFPAYSSSRSSMAATRHASTHAPDLDLYKLLALLHHLLVFLHPIYHSPVLHRTQNNLHSQILSYIHRLIL